MEVRRRLGPAAPHAQSPGAPAGLLWRSSSLPAVGTGTLLVLIPQVSKPRLREVESLRPSQGQRVTVRRAPGPGHSTRGHRSLLALCHSLSQPPEARLAHTSLEALTSLTVELEGPRIPALSISPQIRHSALKCHLPLPLGFSA